MKGMFPLMSLWTLVVSEKLVYLEKGSQRTDNKVMLALSGHCSSCTVFCLQILEHCT